MSEKEGPQDLSGKPAWFIGEEDDFHVEDTEEKAHEAARELIELRYFGADACTVEYSIGAVQHPVDSVAQSRFIGGAICELVCELCDDENGAEVPSIAIDKDDEKELAQVVMAFLKERAKVRWWTVDRSSLKKFSVVVGSPTAQGGGA